MKTHFNNADFAKKMANKMQRLATCLPPAILFEKPEAKSDKGPSEKEKYKTFDIKLSKKEKDSEKVEISVKVFENGTPEDFCKWYEQYNELEEMMPLDTASKKKKIIRSILKDSALEAFNNHISECEEPDKDGKSTEADEDDIEDALEKVTLKVFKNDIHAYRRQVRYMRYQLYFTGTNFQAFLHRLKQLNKYLKYFPISETTTAVTPLPDDDLIEIIDNAKPIEYNQYMLQNNYDPYQDTLEEFSQYIDRLQKSVKIENSLNEPVPRKNKRKKESEGKHKKNNKLHKCKYCKKMVTHDDNDCWEKPGNESKKPAWMNQRPSKRSKKAPTFSGEQLNFLIQQAHFAKQEKTSQPKSLKKRVRYQSESDSDSEHANMMKKLSIEEKKKSKNIAELDSDNDSVVTVEDYFLTNIFNRPKKRTKTGQLTTEVVGEIIARDDTIKPLRILFDTGTTSSIILKPFVQTLSRYKNVKTRWKTMGGIFKTR